MDEGADVIMPVAGPVGLGTAAAILERGNAYLIGVDSDWYESAPEYKSIVLTSVLKKLNVSVVEAARAIADGTFSGGTKVATLANDGVGIAPFHDLDGIVPQKVKDDLPGIIQGIIDGTIKTKP
jgi:basic membrane protein A